MIKIELGTKSVPSCNQFVLYARLIYKQREEAADVREYKRSNISFHMVHLYIHLPGEEK
jgi:hypothetical protein